MSKGSGSHTVFIDRWGPLIGLLGGILGTLSLVLSFWDRWWPPTVDVLDLIPVYISEPKVEAGVNRVSRGAGVVLHVRARSRPVFITGLELDGKRCLSATEFQGFVHSDGRTLDELESEFNQQRPFQYVSFFGWPTGRSGPVSLNPWEESYIKLTFLEPTTDIQTGFFIDRRYLGTSENSSPMTRRFGFVVPEMFSIVLNRDVAWGAGSLRDEILDGILVFRIIAGGRKITVDKKVLRSSRRFDPKTWQESDPVSSLGEQWPPVDRTPSNNQSTNCYPNAHQ